MGGRELQSAVSHPLGGLMFRRPLCFSKMLEKGNTLICIWIIISC